MNKLHSKLVFILSLVSSTIVASFNANALYCSSNIQSIHTTNQLSNKIIQAYNVIYKQNPAKKNIPISQSTKSFRLTNNNYLYHNSMPYHATICYQGTNVNSCTNISNIWKSSGHKQKFSSVLKSRLQSTTFKIHKVSKMGKFIAAELTPTAISYQGVPLTISKLHISLIKLNNPVADYSKLINRLNVKLQGQSISFSGYRCM